MPILSMGGSLTDEVESAFNLTAPVDTATQDGALISRVVRAAEAFVKTEARRTFELEDYVDEAYDIEPGMPDLLLSNRPVKSLFSIKYVISRGSDGSVQTSELAAGDYVLDKTAGIVTLVYGWFPYGPQTVLVSWEAGYPLAEISLNANEEIRVLKQLCLSIAQNWYKKQKDQIGHMASVSFGDESVTINFDLTGDEKRLLNQLRR